MLSEVVLAMTFRQGSKTDPVEQTRAAVFVDTVKNVTAAGINCVVVYVDTEDALIQHMRANGIVPLLQQSSGMGNVRREFLSQAATHFPNAKYLCWIEPEKPDMVRFILPMVQRMCDSRWCLGLFNRRNMKSYPAEQAYYYLFFRAVASKFLGRDVDYSFGPMMFERTMLPYFLNYQSKYSDLWDSILIPRLEIILGGYSYGTLEIDFSNDQRMTQVESGNVHIIKKRLKQFEIVGQSLLNKITP